MQKVIEFRGSRSDAASEQPVAAPPSIEPILAVVDAEPVLSEELLGFLQELARYYVAPIGGAIELSLPAVERTAAELLKSSQSELGKGSRFSVVLPMNLAAAQGAQVVA